RGFQPAERGDIHADANQQWHSLAHGTVGLPSRSEAGLWRRPGRMAAVLRQAGSALGAGRLNPAAPRSARILREIPANAAPRRPQDRHGPETCDAVELVDHPRQIEGGRLLEI